MRLMNGKTMSAPMRLVSVPEKQVVQVIEEDERINRQNPALRLPQQIMQYNLLVDYILNVKDAEHLKRSLDAHFERLVSYHQTFL
jgi:hypothetical protein